MNIDQLLAGINPMWVYLIVGVVIGVESLGLPLPGEIVLVGAALLASTQHHIDPIWVGIAATIGAIVGDSLGYAIGHRYGNRVLGWAGRKFPKHFAPEHVAKARDVFQRRGAWAVFFGRFIALLRILSGPLAGLLHMPYRKFLAANAAGGILWAGGTTALVYYLGIVAENWLSRFSWIGLIVAVLIGIGVTIVVRRRLARAG